MTTLERNLLDYPYMEVPNSWANTIMDCINEIDLLLSIYNLSSNTVEYTEIKEKFNGLRIYYSIPKFINECDEMDEKDLIFHKALDGIIYLIIDKYEKLIAHKIKTGEL